MTKDTDSPPAPGVREYETEPCPFCDSDDLTIVESSTEKFGDGVPIVECDKCGACGPYEPTARRSCTDAEAVEAWNRRALAAPVEPQSPGVPREPTEAMMRAGYNAYGRTLYEPRPQGWGECAKIIYQAMYDARPQEGAPGGQGEGE